MKIALSALFVLVVASPTARAADVFDLHTAYWLKQGTKEAKPLESLSLQQAGKLSPLAAGVSGACIVVKTDKDNWTKALVSWGFVKGPEKPVPVVLIDRYVTYRGDRDNTAAAAGQDVMLFSGFGFDFDLGQVVPDALGDDVGVGEAGALAPRGTATLYALNGSLLPPAEKTDEYDPNSHPEVRARDFAGTWKVDVDGRWRGEWLLKVEEDGSVQGTLTSADSKSSYPITGRVSLPPHRVRLVVHLDNAEQSIDGYLWTKDKSALAGTATLAERKFGFHATRVVAGKNSPPAPE